MPDNFWQRPVTHAPPANPSASTVLAPAGTQPSRDVSLAAAHDAALQATQLAASREAVMAEREELSRKLRDLAAREQTLIERERQIAEQRRIMGEEYRLLRQSQSGRSAASPGARSQGTVGRASNSAEPSNNEQDLTLWQRLSRLVTSGAAVRS
jgi:hypothetical protein